MKTRHYLITATLAYLVFTIATIPAQPVASLVNDNSDIRLEGVTGTLWNGQAQAVFAAGTRLGLTRWNVIGYRLLLGQLALDLDTGLQGQPVQGIAGAGITGKLFAEQLNARLDAATVGQLARLPMGELAGEIEIELEQASWRQGNIPLASGLLRWNNAAVTVAETATLGNVEIQLAEQQDGLLADIKNDGGDIQLSGTAALQADASYKLNLRFTPAASASNNIRQSLGLFAAPQGRDYVLDNSGSLKTLGLL